MKLLIVYGTTEGQTRKICEFLRDKADEAGHEVTLANALEAHIHPGGFDAVVIGASVHAGKYQSAVEHYVQENHEALNHSVTVFLSVSLAAASDEPESWEELKKQSREFLENAGWEPTFVEYIAGALRYSKYNFLKKFIMRMIAQKSGRSTDTSQDTEYTDWEQVEGIIKRLEGKLSTDNKQEVPK